MMILKSSSHVERNIEFVARNGEQAILQEEDRI